MSRLGYVDAASFLCGNCLEYADRMSMANSLEVRAPFTDYKLLEFALRVPERMKVRGTETKWITRQAMSDLLPPGSSQQKEDGIQSSIAAVDQRGTASGDKEISLAGEPGAAWDISSPGGAAVGARPSGESSR